MKHLFSSFAIAAGIIFIQPCLAQTVYPVDDQATAYPLKTQISPTQIRAFEQVFQFGKFDPQKAIALRAKLQPLADVNDPVAAYWLAKTYDWYEFGIGKDSDRPMALKWYRRAAELNYLPAIQFLYHSYRWGFMGIKADYTESAKWLHKSLEVSAGKAKSDILLEFARYSNPNTSNSDVSFPSIPRNITAHLNYLQQAYSLNPKNTSVSDYYGSSLYDAKRYAEALKVWQDSNNPYTWKKVGEMYEQGIGTAPNIPQALFWYKKMAIEGKQHENELNPISRYGKREIYRLVCLKKITPQQATPPYTPEDYQGEFRSWADDKCNFNNAG
ncbi:tetratricopeptide repeat protein [Pseudanabaena sp. PCC 6802]|uniref:tetratricopeptide repeat protein n=1 Tax=Pseudanabaena sp. PCC 6802 TaxID=118173 RepID=UPI00036471DF|nr:SEL1-like repeat protein [Pseudanabaena sp. PCC 6802]